MDQKHVHVVAVGALSLLLASGCAHHRKPDVAPVRIVEPVRVEVPVPVKREPPPELLTVRVYAPSELPQFVAPTDPQASSALTTEGEQQLRALINDLLTRLAAWRAWALSPDDPP